MSKKDYYAILAISRSATQPEIKRAYLKLAKKYHPDKNVNDPDAQKKFQELSEAYDILKDEQKRAAYDRFGHQAFENGNTGRSSSGFSNNTNFTGADINDVFGEFFSDFMGGSRRTNNRSVKVKGSDLKYNLEITLENAFKGFDKQINFSTQVSCSTCSGYGTKDKTQTNKCIQCAGSGTMRIQQGFFTVEQSCNRCNGSGYIIQNPCNVCNGEGRHSKRKYLMVNIPSGIENNTKIRISGEGEAGIRGGSAGDLYIFISVVPHPVYQVNGADLHFKLPLIFTTAILGGEVSIPLIDGSTVKLKVPAGTETGDKIRLKDKGMSKVRSSSRGDLYAYACIRTPKKLNKKQRELIEALDKEYNSTTETDTNNYKDEGFFSRMKNIWS